MKSLKDLYKIGCGPSSSHTMGPQKASVMFRKQFPDADYYEVILYGSLAETGEGHMTNRAIEEAFAPVECRIVMDLETECPKHPNTMDLKAWKGGQAEMWRCYSVGGGAIEIEGIPQATFPEIYPHSNLKDILAYCLEKKIRLPQYVEMVEGPEIKEYLSTVWRCMNATIEEGLHREGILEGGLEIQRKAGILFRQKHMDESKETRENRIVCAYAYAVSEENDSCGRIVTAPTCGASGVVPSVLRYMQEKKGFSDEEIIDALATGGLVGNLIKTNASISGAECGCQAEIGSACSMASAALAELFEMDMEQIEYAAEIALEHHLGLTCDPIKGLVQVPCIERNAVAAMRAINAVSLANFLAGTRKISFDLIVETMYETGKDMSQNYRETSKGGLAKLYK